MQREDWPLGCACAVLESSGRTLTTTSLCVSCSKVRQPLGGRDGHAHPPLVRAIGERRPPPHHNPCFQRDPNAAGAPDGWLRVCRGVLGAGGGEWRAESVDPGGGGETGAGGGHHTHTHTDTDRQHASTLHVVMSPNHSNHTHTRTPLFFSFFVSLTLRPPSRGGQGLHAPRPLPPGPTLCQWPEEVAGRQQPPA